MADNAILPPIEEAPVKLNVNDIVSTEGTDYLVEAVITYRVASRKLVLARITADQKVRYFEPLEDEQDERALLFDEVRDLDVTPPPPAVISYRGGTYRPVVSGRAQATIAGQAPGRAGGPCEVWRYRAAGDLFLQLETWGGQLVVLAGTSVHRSMVKVRPST